MRQGDTRRTGINPVREISLRLDSLVCSLSSFEGPSSVQSGMLLRGRGDGPREKSEDPNDQRMHVPTPLHQTPQLPLRLSFL